MKIFRPKKLKIALLLLVSIAFVAIGISMLEDEAVMGWAGIIFFGLCTIVFTLQFFPNASYIKLTDEGFEVKNLFRSNFTKWSHVKDFKKGEIHNSKMIFYNYTEAHKKWKKGKKVSKFLIGREGAVNSIYSISTDDLLDLMIAYKEKSE